MGETKTAAYACDAPACNATASTPTGWMRVVTSPAVGGKMTIKYVCPTHAPAVTATVTK